VAAYPDDLWFAYAALLALARTGATEEALIRYTDSNIEANAQSAKDALLETDVLALRARIEKDRAWRAPPAQRPAAFRAALQAYENAFRATGSAFPGVNAATAALLAGDGDKAIDLAREIAENLDANPDSEHGEYFALATRVELALILGYQEAARDALGEIQRLKLGDEASRASTRRQLRAICRTKDIPASILTPIDAPSVVHYTGLLMRDTANTADVADRIRTCFDENKVGYAFGSLAAGADMLCAEQALERGARLHVVLPFQREEFRDVSVTRFGASWGKRFDDILGAAASIRYATDDAYLGDDTLFSYTSRLAMGLALLQAQFLDGDVFQLAISDDAPGGSTITGGDMSVWAGTGKRREVIAAKRSVEKQIEPFERESAPRVLRAMMFGDVRGFSKLTERQVPTFVRHYLGRFASVLSQYAAKIEDRNTWGDGLYVVFSDAIVAAECALALQGEIRTIDAGAIGLPADMGLRLGIHFGPVFPIDDPVIGRRVFVGTHVSRTARIEPITPEGSVYATESFAAEIMLSSSERFRAEYVGQIPASKNYGTMRMYSLYKS
jgi:class 3 adenylate cyclase